MAEDAPWKVDVAVHYVPEIQIDYDGGMWWSLPLDDSAKIIEQSKTTPSVIFVWNWGNKSQGAFRQEGEKTGFSRYEFDFSTHWQINLDTKFQRRFRVVMVQEEQAERARTGRCVVLLEP